MENGDYGPACACIQGNEIDEVEEAQAEFAGLGLFEKDLKGLLRRSGVPANLLKKVLALHEKRFPEIHASFAEFKQMDFREPLPDLTVCHDSYCVCINFDFVFDDDSLEACPVCKASRQRDKELLWRTFDLGKIIQSYFLNPCIARALKFAPSFYLNKLETGFGANHIENFTDGSKFKNLVAVYPWLLKGDGMVRAYVRMHVTNVFNTSVIHPICITCVYNVCMNTIDIHALY